jgi:hypothetical protein
MSQNTTNQSPILWGCFLHFYQPANQQPEILEAIVNQSYRRVLTVIERSQRAKVTVTFTGSLLELLQKQGYSDVIDSLGRLMQAGKIELVGTAKYHAFLPLLDEDETKRQIELQEATIRQYFGRTYQPVGFFSPEMAFHPQVLAIAKQFGYRYSLAEEIAYPGKVDWSHFYEDERVPGIKVFLRNKRASVMILAGYTRTADSLFYELSDELPTLKYIVTVMDGETFGHHRPGHEEVLYQFFEALRWQPVLLRDLLRENYPTIKTRLRPCTWSNEEQDFWLDKERKIANQYPFILWQDPGNPIHQLQWNFLRYVIRLVKKYGPEKEAIRNHLDKAEASDHFWWASAKPWWSMEMIEVGAYELKSVIADLPGVTKAERKRVEEYYRQILDQAFDWQRSGEIRRRHKDIYHVAMTVPLKNREKPEWYNQLILEFEDEMKKSAEQLEFEKASHWRDAIIKLRSGADIYEALHPVDDLYKVRTIPSLKPYLEYKPEEISEFARSALLPVKQPAEK